MKGFPITFNIYAENQEEADDARSAIVEFIDEHRLEGRAVTAQKVSKAIRNWRKSNPFVRDKIINYFK